MFIIVVFQVAVVEILGSVVSEQNFSVIHLLTCVSIRCVLPAT